MQGLQSLVGAELLVRGAFHPGPEDGVPGLPDGAPAATLLLLGFAGGVRWPAFAGSPEARDGRRDPLDRWSRRVIDALAARLDAAALYPFGGPPFLPFQRWAQRAEAVFPSPLGILIHPAWGLWHSYRGALALRARLDLPERAAAASPCAACADKPCLSACPVAAFSADGYDAAACGAHIAAPAGAACMDGGCRARAACPAGARHRYGQDETRFYMRSFRATRD